MFTVLISTCLCKVDNSMIQDITSSQTGTILTQFLQTWLQTSKDNTGETKKWLSGLETVAF